MKQNEYGPLVDPAVQQLVPCLMDCFGGWGKSALPLLDKIARWRIRHQVQGQLQTWHRALLRNRGEEDAPGQCPSGGGIGKVRRPRRSKVRTAEFS